MSKVIDETGNRYGHLTVIKRVENNERGNAQWECLCDCGNKSIVAGVALRHGKYNSCGKCEFKKQFIRRVGRNNCIDLTGQRFGKLTVLERVGSYEYGGVKWLCQCDCGNLHYVEASNLKRGNVLSCGCLVSKGEQKIQEILRELNISYKTQYTPKGFYYENGYKPYFDFAIFDNENLSFLLEFHGEQHYKYYTCKNTWNNEENFKKNQRRDKEKEELCQKSNIKLYVISYKDFDKIENLLYNILQSEKYSTINKQQIVQEKKIMKLTVKQAEVFNYVKENGGRVSMEELCAALNSDAKHLNPVVTGLGVKGERAKGLLDYEKIPVEGSDKPAKYVFLTEAGKTFVPSEDDE